MTREERLAAVAATFPETPSDEVLAVIRPALWTAEDAEKAAAETSAPLDSSNTCS
jgi:hypothetical protein